MIINFRDKNFVIATFFRDYCRTAAPARTIHIVAPPTNFLDKGPCGFGRQLLLVF